MKRILFTTVLILILALIIGIVDAHAQTEMTPEEAQRILREDFLTDDVVNATRPVNESLDFMARNYSEKELRNVIRNYELLERKRAAREEREYLPYDRKIDIKNPDEVKRYFKKRTNVVF